MSKFRLKKEKIKLQVSLSEDSENPATLNKQEGGQQIADKTTTPSEIFLKRHFYF